MSVTPDVRQNMKFVSNHFLSIVEIEEYILMRSFP
jgi:hypothetical protein